MDQAGPIADVPTWAHLDTMRLGKWGEYFTKMAFVRAGLDVYSPEVDDRAIDALVRIPGGPDGAPRYLEIQLKTVRAAKPGYIFMTKAQFPIRVGLFLALVRLAEGSEAELYLIPSLAWPIRYRRSGARITRARRRRQSMASQLAHRRSRRCARTCSRASCLAWFQGSGRNRISPEV